MRHKAQQGEQRASHCTPAQQFAVALLFLDPALPQPTVSLMSLHNKLLKNHTGSNAISSFICQPTITADEVDGLQGQAHLRVVL
jgi:hypothetical protein